LKGTSFFGVETEQWLRIMPVCFVHNRLSLTFILVATSTHTAHGPGSFDFW